MEKKVLNAMKKAGKPIRPGDVAEIIGKHSKEVSTGCHQRAADPVEVCNSPY